MPDPVLTWCAAVTTDAEAAGASKMPWTARLARSVHDQDAAVLDQGRVVARVPRALTPGGQFLHNRQASMLARCDPTTMRLVVAVIEAVERRHKALFRLQHEDWDMVTLPGLRQEHLAAERALDAALAALAAHLGEARDE